MILKDNGDIEIDGKFDDEFMQILEHISDVEY